MPITRADLDDLLADLRIHRGDSTGVEVKQATQGLPHDIGTTICAFANMPDGGLIILGVSEAGGFSTTGVADPATMESGLASVARQTVDPAPYIETASIDHDGLGVIVCHVAPLAPSAKPARFRGEAYLRQADGDYVMGLARSEDGRDRGTSRSRTPRLRRLSRPGCFARRLRQRPRRVPRPTRATLIGPPARSG